MKRVINIDLMGVAAIILLIWGVVSSSWQLIAAAAVCALLFQGKR